MGTVSARLPDDLEEELESYLQAERIDRSAAVRRLIESGLEDWRQERALERLEAGEVSFTRAAELAGLSVWDFAALAAEEGCTWVSDEHLADDLHALGE